MKEMYFIVQGKGGVGKSFLTWLYAIKNENNPKVIFVDIDQINKSSQKALNFIRIDKRVLFYNCLDEEKKISREKFVRLVTELYKMNFDKFYIDFGGSESEQIIHLFSDEKNIDFLESYGKKNTITIKFLVVMSGGDPYNACIEYLRRLNKVAKSDAIIAMLNDFRFKGHEQQKKELEVFTATNKIGLANFGNFDFGSETLATVTTAIKNGTGSSQFKDDDLTKHMISFASKNI
ncbi:MAG: hypothetical protein QM528_02815 [Phycisphaerales bacterium]|nr:hypothetical protein [Phycisphaerales bacterium]